MTLHSISTEPDLATDTRNADAAYYRGVLRGLVDMGTDLIRLVQTQAKVQVEQAEPDAAPALAADAAVAYERITRSIRRSIMLAERLGEPVVAPIERGVGHRSAARRGIIRGVEDAIERHADGAHAESLHAELLDRLDGPDLADDIESRPVGEIIAEICRDFGLDVMPGLRPWKRRRPADIAVLCARAAGVGSAGGMVLPVLARRDDALQEHGRAGCRGP